MSNTEQKTGPGLFEKIGYHYIWLTHKNNQRQEVLGPYSQAGCLFPPAFVLPAGNHALFTALKAEVYKITNM